MGLTMVWEIINVLAEITAKSIREWLLESNRKDGWDEDQFPIHLNYLPEPIFLFIVFKENYKTKTNSLSRRDLRYL